MAVATPAAAAPSPVATDAAGFPALTGRVVDDAGLLDPGASAALDAKLAALETKTGHQFVIVTVPSLGGRAIDAYGTALGNHWGVGRADHDDGVLLIVAPNEKKVRIAVGKGLEKTLTDGEADAIIKVAILPRFEKGEFSKGIVAGSDAILKQIGEGK